MEPTTEDLLNDLELNINLQPVSLGLRLANYLVDLIAFYAMSYLVGIALGLVFLLLSVDARNLAPEVGGGGFQLTMWLFNLLIYATYYFLVEGATGGRSLGKMVTGTIAVTEEGSRITWKKALERSLCRIVPFDALSGLFNGDYRFWHDRWTRTLVIKR